MKRRDVAVLICLVLLGLLVRFLTAETVQIGGDAYQYWNTAYKLVCWEHFVEKTSPPTHWSARFGVIIPVAIVQVVFGGRLINYYIAPVLAFVSQLIVVHVTGAFCLKRGSGFLA
ncbi:hypothetical protein ACFL0Q_08570, partial [Thermodesulfobacteriota bacterium]